MYLHHCITSVRSGFNMGYNCEAKTHWGSNTGLRCWWRGNTSKFMILLNLLICSHYSYFLIFHVAEVLITFLQSRFCEIVGINLIPTLSMSCRATHSLCLFLSFCLSISLSPYPSHSHSLSLSISIFLSF